jgi:raffinose/stachyose/melibiose transport system substrate-binding protein
VVNGSTEAIKRPVLRMLAENVGRAKYHQVYYDQMLGASVGAVVNDISQGIAADKIKPAWKQAN